MNNGSLALLALIALALCGLALWPLWRSMQRAVRVGALPRITPDAPDAAALLRAQWQHWKTEERAGRVAAAEAERAREELLQRLADEDAMAARAAAPHATQGPGGTGRAQAPWALLLVPTVALLVYAFTGDPLAVQRNTSDGSAAVSQRDAEAFVARLSEALHAAQADSKGQPGDPALPGLDAGAPEAWVWLARLQADLRQFQEAEQAYARAIALRPDVPQWLVDRADLYLVAHGASDGEAQRLVQRALQLAPDHPKALAIAGGLAFDRGEAAQARRLWARARSLVPADSGFAQELDRSLAAAMAEGAGAPDPATAISGTVQLAPELAAQAKPEAAVFVVVRAAGQGTGPRMPLAVRRHSVAELPLRFTLDAEDAMTPTAGWAAGDALEVEVLVSQTGEARAQAGDLVAGPVGVKAGASGVGLVVNRLKR